MRLSLFTFLVAITAISGVFATTASAEPPRVMTIHNETDRALCQILLAYHDTSEGEPKLEARLGAIEPGESESVEAFLNYASVPNRRYFLTAHTCETRPIRIAETPPLEPGVSVDVVFHGFEKPSTDAGEGATLVAASIFEPSDGNAVVEIINELGTDICSIGYAPFNGNQLDTPDRAVFGQKGPFAHMRTFKDGESIVLNLRGAELYHFQATNCTNDAWLFSGTIDVAEKMQVFLLQEGAEPKAKFRDGFREVRSDAGAKKMCPEIEFTAEKTAAYCDAFMKTEWRHACAAEAAQKVKLGRKLPFCGTL